MLRRIRTYWKLHQIPLMLLALSLLFYFVFAYSLQRTDFIKLLCLFAALFLLTYKLIQFEKWNYRFLLLAGLLFRLVFLFSVPNLSQDFYRFLWDGMLVWEGINPYLHVPDDLLTHPALQSEQARLLYQGMGSLSAGNISTYPPLNQVLFALAAFLGGKGLMGGILVLRCLSILADIGIFILGRKLLKHLNRSPHLIFWYFLNPLVIIELSGNLHGEGIMLFFFLWAIYLLTTHKWLASALVYALSAGIKLIPLLFLPLFLKTLGLRKGLLFCIICGTFTLLMFLPFYDPFLFSNYLTTLRLWFTNFEFNAGIFNLLKLFALEMEIPAWKWIRTYGKITPFLILGTLLLLLYLQKKNALNALLTSMLGILTVYYLLASALHPWYLIFLLGIALFTHFRFPLLWSALVVLSYAAYSNPDFRENGNLLFVEYFIVFGFLSYEIINLRNQKLLFNKN